MTVQMPDRPCVRCGSIEFYVRSNGNRMCAPCDRKRQIQTRRAMRTSQMVFDDKRRCSKCGILLDHPATMDCGDTCGVCCGKRAAQIPGTYDVEVFVPLYRMAW